MARPTTRRNLLLAAGTAAASTTAASSLWFRANHVEVPLISETVALTTPTQRATVPVGRLDLVVPGTRVFAGRPQTAALVQSERTWLSACADWTHTTDSLSSAVRSAQLDLRVLTTGLPASIAGWTPLWRYTWPRDASCVAVALGLLGHHGQAWQQIAFLARMHTVAGGFEARYDPWKRHSPDGRAPQLDGSGWVLWAVTRLARSTAPPPACVALARRLTRHLLGTVDPRTGLPPASPDYWEVPEQRLTLGTAAAVAMGLLNAAEFWKGRDPSLAASCRSTGGRVLDAVHRTFGRNGYPRYTDDDKPDTAITFLLPPFLPGSPDPDVVKALDRAERMMARPAGGLAPGAGWKDDGISWTPETAMFALTRASVGDTQRAASRVQWLADHRTAAGSYPEKVLHDGAPAAVAPLGWTAALIILAIRGLRGA